MRFAEKARLSIGFTKRYWLKKTTSRSSPTVPMLFNSVEFALFFPVVCCLYFAAPLRARVPLLLGASCVFYMAFIPAYILILFLTIGIDYAAGIYIERTKGPARRYWLFGSIISTCA